MAARKRKAVDDDMTQHEKKAGTSDAAAPPAPITSTVPPQRPDSYFRNLYSKEPDFELLGKRDAEFAALYVRRLFPILGTAPNSNLTGRLKGNGQLDFTDPKAVVQLTKTLLVLDFGLRIDLPDDRLCPPV